MINKFKEAWQRGYMDIKFFIFMISIIGLWVSGLITAQGDKYVFIGMGLFIISGYGVFCN